MPEGFDADEQSGNNAVPMVAHLVAPSSAWTRRALPVLSSPPLASQETDSSGTGARYASVPLVESTSGNRPIQNNEDEIVNPLAFLFASLTRTALFVVKRVGLSPEVLQSFLQRKAFMRIATTHSASSSSTTKASATPESSSLPTGRNQLSNVGAVERHRRLHPFPKAAEIIKSSILGVAVFGMYDIVLSGAHLRQGRMLKEEEDRTKPRYVPDMDRVSLVGHAGAGAMAGFVQSVLVDGYELAFSYCGWKRQQRENEEARLRQQEQSYACRGHDTQKQLHHRHTQRFRVNKQVIVRRAVHDSIGFATLFGTYEASRRYLEGTLIGTRSPWYPGPLPRDHTNMPALDGPCLGKSSDEGIFSARSGMTQHQHNELINVGPAMATFVAGGVAGQAHLIVNHYTHNLYRTERGKSKANSQRGLSKNPTRRFIGFPSCPPKASTIAGAFLPSGLCFLAFRYGGVLVETLLDDKD